MDLTSCTNCGIVLNKDHLYFPKDIYTKEGNIDLDLATYNHKTSQWEAFTPCPVCKNPILKGN